MMDVASRFVSLSAETYARCQLGRLSPATGSPMFPDAPSLALSGPQQSVPAPPQLQSKPSALKPSAVMHESLKRSLAQAHSQLAQAPLIEKPPAQPQTTDAAGAGAAHNAGSLGATDAPADAVQTSQQDAQEKSSLRHEPGKIAALNAHSYPAAAPCMPQYGSQGTVAAAAPGSAGHEKQKEATEQRTKTQHAADGEPAEDPPSDARLWYASSPFLRYAFK